MYVIQFILAMAGTFAVLQLSDRWVSLLIATALLGLFVYDGGYVNLLASLYTGYAAAYWWGKEIVKWQ